MRQLARGLQMVALFLLPLGMILQIANSISVGQMLMLLVAGFSLFYIGRILEGYLRPGGE
ncbi:MAG TPA: hypothetical protein VG826_32735 [Pirellulales bacterium]|nr:hypothetical protein [Pirellulales bacterium]